MASGSWRPTSSPNFTQRLETTDKFKEFGRHLRSCTVTSAMHDPPREFVDCKSLWAILQRDDSSFVKSLIWDAVHYRGIRRELQARGNAYENLIDTMTPDNPQCWVELLTILFRLNRTAYIWVFWEAGSIYDSSLPIAKEELKKRMMHMGLYKFESADSLDALADGFCDIQGQLCGPKLLHSNMGSTLPSTVVLPIHRKEPLRTDGKSSTPKKEIFLVEIRATCISENIRTLANRLRIQPFPHEDENDPHTYYEFVLKTFENESEYNQERLAYQHLQMQKGIVQSLGHWKLELPEGRGSKYYILLEYAQCDLYDHFGTFPSLATGGDIFNFWESLFSIVEALAIIHGRTESAESGESAEWLGWHLDLKPENIFRCDGGWKIADPGLSEFVAKEDAHYRDGYPVHSPRGETRAWSPPEHAVYPDRPVTQMYDIWSLGCIFSEAAAWVVFGSRGVELYALSRKHMNSDEADNLDLALDRPIEGDDIFHRDPKSYVPGSKEPLGVSPAVTLFHERIRRGLRQEDVVTSSILELVDDCMLLPEATMRITSTELVEKMKHILDAARTRVEEFEPPQKSLRRPMCEEQKKFFEMQKNPLAVQERRSNRHKTLRHMSHQVAPALGIWFDAPPVASSSLAAPPMPQRGFTAPVPGERSYAHRPRQYRPEVAQPQSMGGRRRSTKVKSYAQGNSSKHLDSKYDYWDARADLERQGAWKFTTNAVQRVDDASQSLAPVDPKGKIGRSLSHRSTSSTVVPQTTTTSGKKRRRTAILFTVDKMFKKTVRSPTNASNLEPLEKSRHTVSMDERYRTFDFDEHFSDRDVVFLVDNAPTMEPHWERLKDLLLLLAVELHGQDDNGMELYFTSSPRERHGPWQNPNDFRKAAEARDKTPKAGGEDEGSQACDFHGSLQNIFTLIDQKHYNRKLTLIIFTDGIWEGIQGPNLEPDINLIPDTIELQLRRWLGLPGFSDLVQKRHLTIQFIQFGSDPTATQILSRLDDDLYDKNGRKLPDIIDREPADGHIIKMIIGSVDDTWDRRSSVSEESQSYPPSNHGEHFVSNPHIRQSPPPSGFVPQGHREDIFASPPLPGMNYQSQDIAFMNEQFNSQLMGQHPGRHRAEPRRNEGQQYPPYQGGQSHGSGAGRSYYG